MTIKYECDRCGDDDDLHTREIRVEHLMPYTQTLSDLQDVVLHLCGYCHSQFRNWVSDDG